MAAWKEIQLLRQRALVNFWTLHPDFVLPAFAIVLPWIVALLHVTVHLNMQFWTLNISDNSFCAPLFELDI